MKATLKKFLNMILNTYFLNVFGLKISKTIGDNSFQVMKDLLGRHDDIVIIDGGAYQGTFSLDARQFFSKAVVHAFEPQKDSYNLLLNATRHDSMIKQHNVALSESDGTAEFHINSSPLTNSLSTTSRDGNRYFQGFNDEVRVETVEVMSLSSFLRSEEIDRVDILKLDLQGHELSALKGMGEDLRKVKAIYLEIQFLEIYDGTPLFSEVANYLDGFGFSFYNFFGLTRSPIDGRMLYGDALFFASELDLPT